MSDRTIEGLETNLDAIAVCVRSEGLSPLLKSAWPDMAEILTDAATQLRRLRKVFEEEPASEGTPEDADVRAVLEKGNSVEILRDVVLHRLKWPPLDRESLSPWLLQLQAIVQRVIDLGDTPEGAAHPERCQASTPFCRCQLPKNHELHSWQNDAGTGGGVWSDVHPVVGGPIYEAAQFALLALTGAEYDRTMQVGGRLGKAEDMLRAALNGLDRQEGKET